MNIFYLFFIVFNFVLGFCFFGGIIYLEGLNFICVDNINYCSCMEGGGFVFI